jgi:hypothetical protein
VVVINPIISSRNIIPRFRDAFNALAEVDGDLADFGATLTDDEWHRFVSHAAGFITCSLRASEERLDSTGGKDEAF